MNDIDIVLGFDRGLTLSFATTKLNKKDGTLVYRNEMNSIIFPKSFTARDYDIFFTICWYAKQKNYSEVTDFIEMPFSEIADFYEKNLNKTRFNNEVMDFVNKVMGDDRTTPILKIKTKNSIEESVRASTFFMDIETFRNKQILRFKMYKYSVEMLFSLLNFVNINMYDFVSIKGKFAKTLYRILKQYSNVKTDENGYKNVYLKRDFLESVMNVPNNYDAYDITRKVISPSVSELENNYFKKLSFEKIISDKSCVGYHFKFVS